MKNKTCKIELNTSEIERALEKRKTLEKPRDIEKIDKKINDLKKRDVCTCPDDTEILSIKSKASSKVMKSSAILFPLAGLTFGAAALPLVAAMEKYESKKNRFPPCVDKLDDVKEVRANWAALSSLENVDKMESVESLQIDWNVLKSIEPVANMKKLKRFIMNHNMEQIDLEPLSRVDGLEEVSVMGSNIKNVGSLAKLDSLKRLNVAFTGTRLEKIKDVIINNPDLEFLNITGSEGFFTCKGRKYGVTVRVKKEKIDEIRECLAEGTLKSDWSTTND